MKTKTYILLMALSAGAVALPLQAAETQTRADRVEAFKESLDLSPKQTEKIQSILQNQRQQVQTLRQNENMSREQKMEKAREVAKTTIDEIRPVLTPEQKNKLGQVAERFREAVQTRATERREAVGAVGTQPE